LFCYYNEVIFSLSCSVDITDDAAEIIEVVEFLIYLVFEFILSLSLYLETILSLFFYWSTFWNCFNFYFKS